MDRIELDVQMTYADMYRFNLYHAYHNSQGVMSVVLGVLLVCISLLSWSDGNLTKNVLYLAAAVLVVCYVPINLRARVKKQMKNNELFAKPLHYTFDENGITTTFDGQSVTMPWIRLYKLVSTKRMVLLYGGRIRANVIPRDQMDAETYRALYALAKEHMPAYCFKMKKETGHGI